MIFIETPVFTRRVLALMPDEAYAALQHFLLLRPDAGAVIPQSGGLRKVRWRLPGSGKRGGLRLIYYFDPPYDTIYLLLNRTHSVFELPLEAAACIAKQ